MRDDTRLFADNLKLYMDKYEYTQLSLSDKLNVSNASVSRYMSGEVFPRLPVIDKMCELFHCSKGDLLEKEHTQESVENSETERRLMSYFSRLNPDGMKKVINYIEDLKEEYFI